MASASSPIKPRVVILFVLGVLLVLAAAGGVFYFFFWEPATQSGTAPAAGPRSQTVALHFFSTKGSKDSTRAFRMPEHLAFPEQIRAILEKMAEKNPDSLSTLWPATLRLHNVFLRKNGLLILDLEQGVTYNHASAASEWRTVRSLAATLLANYPNVKAVKFLVNGLEQDTLSGHVALAWPFTGQDLEP
jgi:spore germination protein GerM